ncbi:unnamed protein product [Effrenium voratum]|nr:unnamed protein product [Effrenium voratum]
MQLVASHRSPMATFVPSSSARLPFGHNRGSASQPATWQSHFQRGAQRVAAGAHEEALEAFLAAQESLEGKGSFEHAKILMRTSGW